MGVGEIKGGGGLGGRGEEGGAWGADVRLGRLSRFLMTRMRLKDRSNDLRVGHKVAHGEEGCEREWGMWGKERG